MESAEKEHLNQTVIPVGIGNGSIGDNREETVIQNPKLWLDKDKNQERKEILFQFNTMRSILNTV